VLPSKLQYRSPWVPAYQPVEVEHAGQDTVDLLEESRDIVIARSARYQQMLQ
jgi:hypothetical protein